MVTNFNWENFQSPDNTESPSPDQKQENMSWGQFQNPNTYQGPIDPTADESTFGYLVRNLTSNIARAGERFLGKYGDIQNLTENILKKAPSTAGLLGNTIHSMIGQDAWDMFISGGSQAPKLPTSEEVKGITESLSGKYTNPKTKNEARLQEISGDIGGMGRRIPQASTTRALVNNIGIPVAMNAVKETIKELGFGEEKGNWAKSAAGIALSLLTNVNAPAYAANLMNIGRQGFGPNNVANVQRYESSINRAARNMLQGDPRSALAQQQISGIRNDIATGQNTMPDLMNRYDAINAAKRDRGLFELSRPDRRAAIRNIDQVRDAVREEINILGRSNPQALDAWQNGVRAFSTIHQSRAISNFARNQLQGPLAKSAIAGVFGASAFKAPLIAGTTAGVAPATYKIGQVGYRIWSNPTLARYYWNAMAAAARQDGPVFISNFNKLDKAYNSKYKD